MSKKSKYFILIVFVVFIGIYAWNKLTWPQRNYNNSMDLLYSNINGRIVYFESSRGATIIRLNSRDEDVFIRDVIDSDGQEKSIENLIRVGDSIYSPYSSDSIYIIRDNEKQGYRIAINYAD
jgi:hypothetical protein